MNYEGEKFHTWSFNFTYQTGRPYTAPNSIFSIDDIDVPIFIERNNARLRPYHRLDLSWKIKYSKNPRKMSTSLHCFEQIIDELFFYSTDFQFSCMLLKQKRYLSMLI